MKVYLCAMAKNEHYYINEWVHYYLNIGVDKIFVFDNDDKDSPFLKDFIDKDILPKVRIINARGKHWDKMQHDLYTNFYNVEKDNFDYCIYCDIDEYLVGVKDIKAFLSSPQFRLYEQIRVKWKLFGDDNIVFRDKTQPVFGAFTKEIENALSPDLSRVVKLHNQAKTIIKGHLQSVRFDSVHFASRGNRILNECLPSGKTCSSGVEIHEDYSHEKVFFNHYMTKSLSEFIEQKMNRTDAVFGNRQLKLNYFWRINEKTQEKLDYLKDLGLDINI